MNRLDLSQPLVALVSAGLGLDVPRPNPLSIGESDWQDLCELAHRHGLSSLLLAGSGVVGAQPPAELERDLRRKARALEVRNVLARDQFRAIVMALNARSIEPILLKGMLFALRYYPTPGLRPFADLDLLVPVSARDESAEILLSMGYRSYESPDGRDRNWYAANHHHWIFVPPRGLPVEIHWQLTNPASSAQFDLEGIWQRARPLRENGIQANILSIEDQLAYLAVHAANHIYQVPLRAYADLAAMLSKESQPEWTAVWRHAEGIGAARDLALYLCISHALGFICLPTDSAERATTMTRAAIKMQNLMEYAVDWPFRDQPWSLVKMMARPSAGSLIPAFCSAVRLFCSRYNSKSTEEHGFSGRHMLTEVALRRLFDGR